MNPLWGFLFPLCLDSHYGMDDHKLCHKPYNIDKTTQLKKKTILMVSTTHLVHDGIGDGGLVGPIALKGQSRYEKLNTWRSPSK